MQTFEDNLPLQISISFTICDFADVQLDQLSLINIVSLVILFLKIASSFSGICGVRQLQ